MFFLDAIFTFVRELISIFWLPFIDTPPSRHNAERDVSLDRNKNDLEMRRTPTQSAIAPRLEHAESNMEKNIVTNSFIAQLEQRTRQVKITLANLEAEKTRIEEQIAQLTPLIPHYDALLEAERALARANIGVDDAEAEPPAPTDSDAPVDEEPVPPTSSWTPHKSEPLTNTRQAGSDA